jgi:hypothetical protein
MIVVELPEAPDTAGDEEDDDDPDPPAGAPDQGRIAVVVAQVRDAEDVARPDPGRQQGPYQHRRRQAPAGDQEVLLLLQPLGITQAEHEQKQQIQQDGYDVCHVRLLSLFLKPLRQSSIICGIKSRRLLGGLEFTGSFSSVTIGP